MRRLLHVNNIPRDDVLKSYFSEAVEEMYKAGEFDAVFITRAKASSAPIRNLFCGPKKILDYRLQRVEYPVHGAEDMNMYSQYRFVMQKQNDIASQIIEQEPGIAKPPASKKEINKHKKKMNELSASYIAYKEIGQDLYKKRLEHIVGYAAHLSKLFNYKNIMLVCEGNCEEEIKYLAEQHDYNYLQVQGSIQATFGDDK
jgi:hypothetical protein